MMSNALASRIEEREEIITDLVKSGVSNTVATKLAIKYFSNEITLEDLESLKENLVDKIENVENRLNTKIDSLEKVFNTKIESLEKNINSKIDEKLSFKNQFMIVFSTVLLTVVVLALAKILDKIF